MVFLEAQVTLTTVSVTPPCLHRLSSPSPQVSQRHKRAPPFYREKQAQRGRAKVPCAPQRVSGGARLDPTSVCPALALGMKTQ